MDLIEKNNTPIPNFIKLDVDGNELAVLQGFGDHLSDIRMKGIIIELDVYNPESKNLLIYCGRMVSVVNSPLII